MKYDAVLKGLEHISEIFGKVILNLLYQMLPVKLKKIMPLLLKYKNLELQDKKAVVATGGKENLLKKKIH